MPTPIDQLTNGHARMGVSAGNKPLDLTEFFQRRQRLLREQERERAHAQWERREGILPAQMTAAMQMLSRMAGRAYYPKDLSPDNLPKKVYRQLYQDYQSPGDRDFSKPHVVEITPTPDNSAEAQAAIFSGAGVEHNPGARYGYRTDNDSKQAAFPTPLTEEQMASCDLLVEHLASCADQLGLDAAAVESLVNLRESITDPDEYQAVVDVIREIGCSLLRHAYQSMDEDITGTSNGNGQKRRKQQADMENDEDEDEVNSDIGCRVAKAALTKPLKGAR